MPRLGGVGRGTCTYQRWSCQFSPQAHTNAKQWPHHLLLVFQSWLAGPSTGYHASAWPNTSQSSTRHPPLGWLVWRTSCRSCQSHSTPRAQWVSRMSLVGRWIALKSSCFPSSSWVAPCRRSSQARKSRNPSAHGTPSAVQSPLLRSRVAALKVLSQLLWLS